MSTNFVSLLPFLAALQRNQNMQYDDDDSTPPVDQFGHVLPSRGNGVPPQSANTGRSGEPGAAPGASQSNLAQTDALQNYQGQSNSIDDLVYRIAPGTPPLLMQLLQAGTYPSPPPADASGTPYPSPPTPGASGTLQSSNPNQAQATNDDDDSQPPVGPSGLIGELPGASQSNMQSDAIGDIIRSMKPGALPVYPPQQQEEQAALKRGQATQPPVSDAQRQAGLVIRVGIRRLLPGPPGAFGHHTYLEIPRLDQDDNLVYNSAGNIMYDSYGVLGQWDDKKGDGTTDNQQVLKNDIHLGKNGLQIRNGPKPGSDNNALYEIAVTPEQLAALRASAEHWSQWQTTGDKCPSCGDDYVRGGGPYSRPGYNSNTWVYNMLVQNPAGPIEPPAEITKKALESRNGEHGKPALDIFAPGWAVNDSSKEYYPGLRSKQPGKLGP